jgi:hypothetical protein
LLAMRAAATSPPALIQIERLEWPNPYRLIGFCPRVTGGRCGTESDHSHVGPVVPYVEFFSKVRELVAPVVSNEPVHVKQRGIDQSSFGLKVHVRAYH